MAAVQQRRYCGTVADDVGYSDGNLSHAGDIAILNGQIEAIGSNLSAGIGVGLTEHNGTSRALRITVVGATAIPGSRARRSTLLHACAGPIRVRRVFLTI
jgi:hypothetical protein